ncbi:hypothetical protein [Shimia abyssi]|uniref:Histidinol phosphate aminotransferase n=1 Tax=Shimia abyssi TaxID=1662395 RepID=A0A2P8FH37_9RHOB|nr:hypothetical protein [Shimia abyssi]PSL21018.1 hypothetical protein CLV88_102137 [Shimia abyssi]
MSRPIQRVENYTITCLVMGFVNLIWIFGVLWVVWGLPAVMVLAVILNAGIDRIGQKTR